MFPTSFPASLWTSQAIKQPPPCAFWNPLRIACSRAACTLAFAVGASTRWPATPAQLGLKESLLRETLERAGIGPLPPLRIWGSPQPWEYRNRIRLRVRTVDGALRLGYSLRATNDFLPIRMCPIASPVLWRAAEKLMQTAAEHRQAAAWLGSAAEVEISCDEQGTRVQVHLLCPGAAPPGKNSFAAFAGQLKTTGLELTSMGASRLHAASGRPTQQLASWGADGLTYAVDDQRFWLERGSFFQINRFLLPAHGQSCCGQSQRPPRMGPVTPG